MREAIAMFVTTAKDHERQAMDEVYDRLQNRFAALSPREVGAVVHEVADGFSDAKIRDYLPVLVEHIARERLARQTPHPSRGAEQGSANTQPITQRP